MNPVGPLGLLLLAVATGPGEAPPPGAAHPAALSRLTLRFEAESIRLELQVQELTLREVPRWNLDADGNGHLSNLEVEDRWPQVAAMVESQVWLELDGEVQYPRWSILEVTGDLHEAPGGGVDFQYLVLEASLPRPSELETVLVHSDLFLEDGNPGHILDLSASGFGGAERRWLLRGVERDWRLDLPDAGGVLWRYTVLGWDHVLEGWDHLAFLLALLFGVRGFRSLLGAVTAFTLAHSVTLALSSLGVLALPPTLVEPGIALSVLLVLAWHLRRPLTAARAWIPALAFGFLHGFGFAGVLGELGLPTRDQVWSLLGFNLGVEAGQLTFVLPVVLMAWILLRGRDEAERQALRGAAAIPIAAFCVHLVGDVLLSNWGPELEGAAGLAAAWGVGSLVLALTLLPGGDDGLLRRWRRIGLQGSLLCAFFLLGRGLR